MYRINKNRKSVDKIEETTLADVGMKENDVEEMLREDIQMLEGEEVSLLVVGKQVQNQQRGRSDLTAIDANGNIVLIEIKRDRNDMEQRREPFEFQAIRYAASYCTIKSKNDLVQLVYAPYLEKCGDQTKKGELTFHEWGYRSHYDFLDKNQKERCLSPC